MVKPKLLSGIFLIFAVIISVFGMISLPMLLMQPFKSEFDFSSVRILIGSLYVAVCLLGVSAVFQPNKCQRSFAFGTTKRMQEEGNSKELFEMHFKGHHPSCEYYAANRVEIRNTVHCASCAGLLIGAVAAIIGTMLYFFAGAISLPEDFKILLISNLVMLLGLFQFKLGGYLKLAMNALFVFSSFITLAMTDLLGGSLELNSYSLCLIVFLLFTRITFSQWNNRRICLKCNMCKLHRC